MHHPTDRIAHTIAIVIPVMEHWLEQEIAQWVHHGEVIQQSIIRCADALLWSYILLKYIILFDGFGIISCLYTIKGTIIGLSWG